MTWSVRGIREDDFASYADIVNHYILTGAIHFGDQPQAREDWLEGWLPLRERYPWLVAEQDGTVGGIAYAKPWNSRQAYDWTVEVTVYVRDGLHRRGIGSALYGRLLHVLDAQGYRSVIAGLTLPNDGSAWLHESFGFQRVGTLRRVGYKHGRWHDVEWWQRLSAFGDAGPSSTAPLHEIPGWPGRTLT